MGHGSPLCAKLCERIVSQFKDNVSQCKIAKNLGLSPSTVHNIVKIFRESGEILVRKGQGRETAAECVWPSSPQVVLFEKPSCYHDGHSHMGSGVLWKIIVTQHSPPLHQEMQLEIVLCKEEGIYKFCTETLLSSLGPKSSEMDRKTVETCSLVRLTWFHTFQLVFGKNGERFCAKNDHPDQRKPVTNAKTSLCDGMGVHQCPGHGWSAYMWRYHWCRGLRWNFGETYAAIKTTNFSQELHVYFSRTMPGLILHSYNSVAFIGIECVCLTGLPAVQICLLLKMSWHIMKRRIRQRLTMDCWAAQVLCTPRMTPKIPLAHWNTVLGTSVPKWLQSVIKRKVMLPSGKHASVPTVFWVCCRHQWIQRPLQMCLQLQNWCLQWIEDTAEGMFVVLLSVKKSFWSKLNKLFNVYSFLYGSSVCVAFP